MTGCPEMPGFGSARAPSWAVAQLICQELRLFNLGSVPDSARLATKVKERGHARAFLGRFAPVYGPSGSKTEWPVYAVHVLNQS